MSFVVNQLRRLSGYSSSTAPAPTTAFANMSFYSFSATKGDGSTLNMEDCRGKVVYATNVASK